MNIGENFLNKLLSNQIQKYIKKIIYLQTKYKSTTKRSSTLYSKIIIIKLTRGLDGKQDGADSAPRGKSVVTTMVMLETNQVNNTINVQKVKSCLYVSPRSFRTSGNAGNISRVGAYGCISQTKIRVEDKIRKNWNKVFKF